MTTPDGDQDRAALGTAPETVIPARTLAVIDSWANEEPTERWKPIPGWEGLYEVSDQGRVRSLDRVVERIRGGSRTLAKRILAPRPSGRERRLYPTVQLCRNGIVKNRKVHQLVLEAFVGPRPEGMQACHGNDVATDNRPSNLRWASKSANAHDQVANGNHRQARKTHCPAGHAYNENNTYFKPRTGSRECRACKRQQGRQRNRQQRAITVIANW